MKPDRSDKKSETIKFRVPWSLKRDFMAKAKMEGRSASDIFRDLAEDYLRRPVQRTTTQTLETAMTAIRTRPRMSFAALLGAAGISAVLAGAIPAGAASDLRAAFERMDTNGDGAVTLEEMTGGDRSQVQRFELERREGAPLEFGLAPLDGPPPGSSEAPQVEKFGPILLPAEVDGEDRVVMIQQMRQRGGDGGVVMELNSPPPLEEEFEAGDANDDGVLSFAEFEQRYMVLRANSFTALDANGDGALDEAEMTANPLGGPGGDRIADALRGIDANGDGRVTRAEYEDAV